MNFDIWEEEGSMGNLGAIPEEPIEEEPIEEDAEPEEEGGEGGLDDLTNGIAADLADAIVSAMSALKSDDQDTSMDVNDGDFDQAPDQNGDGLGDDDQDNQDDQYGEFGSGMNPDPDLIDDDDFADESDVPDEDTVDDGIPGEERGLKHLLADLEQIIHGGDAKAKPPSDPMEAESDNDGLDLDDMEVNPKDFEDEDGEESSDEETPDDESDDEEQDAEAKEPPFGPKAGKDKDDDEETNESYLAEEFDLEDSDIIDIGTDDGSEGSWDSNIVPDGEDPGWTLGDVDEIDNLEKNAANEELDNLDKNADPVKNEELDNLDKNADWDEMDWASESADDDIAKMCSEEESADELEPGLNEDDMDFSQDMDDPQSTVDEDLETDDVVDSVIQGTREKADGDDFNTEDSHTMPVEPAYEDLDTDDVHDTVIQGARVMADDDQVNNDDSHTMGEYDEDFDFDNADLADSTDIEEDSLDPDCILSQCEDVEDEEGMFEDDMESSMEDDIDSAQGEPEANVPEEAPEDTGTDLTPEQACLGEESLDPDMVETQVDEESLDPDCVETQVDEFDESFDEKTMMSGGADWDISASMQSTISRLNEQKQGSVNPMDVPFTPKFNL